MDFVAPDTLWAALGQLRYFRLEQSAQTLRRVASQTAAVLTTSARLGAVSNLIKARGSCWARAVMIALVWVGAVLVGNPAEARAELVVPVTARVTALVTVPVTSSSAEAVAKRSAEDIASEKVGQFVSAYLQVVTLIEQRESDLQRVETESESLQLQRQIQSEALTLIEKAGLTWSEYQQLLGLANSDPDFRDRILAQVEESSLQANEPL